VWWRTWPGGGGPPGGERRRAQKTKPIPRNAQPGGPRNTATNGPNPASMAARKKLTASNARRLWEAGDVAAAACAGARPLIDMNGVVTGLPLVFQFTERLRRQIVALVG